MSKSEAGNQAMSAESIAYLEEVKKGKPRKFAMICKGTSVVSLVVYKKGNVEKRRKEAKESGKGQFYFGVVDGKGIDIRFVLARTDGFDSEPVKRAALKDFIEESAELKLKPYFEIVDAIPLVLDEDDPLTARFLLLQAQSDEASVAHPDQASALKTLCRQAASYLDQDQTEQATTAIEQLEQLLGQLGYAPVAPATSPAQTAPVAPSSPPPTPTPAPPPPQPTTPPPAATTPPPAPPPPSLEGRDQFLARLKILKPQIDSVINANSEASALIKELAGQAGIQARQQQFVQANSTLDSIEQALAKLGASASASAAAAPGASDDLGAVFTARLKGLMPVITRAKAGTTAVDKEISLKVSEAAALARGQKFNNALGCLDRIEELAKLSTASQAEFSARLKKIKPALDQALAGSPPGSDQAKALASQLAGFARAQDFASGMLVLVRLEELLAADGTDAPVAPSASQPKTESALGPKVALQQSILMWDAARKRIDTELGQLETEVLELFEGDELAAEVEDNIHKLDAVLGDYADELRDRLDAAYQASDEDKPPYIAAALESLTTYRNYLSSDPFISDVATNLLRPIDIEGVLGRTLDAVAQRLSAPVSQ